MNLAFYSDPAAAASARQVAICPRKIVGVGRNYRAHAQELGNEPPAEPLLFLKAPSAILAPGAPIYRPAGYERVDFEGELGIVIGRSARRVSTAVALDHVLGYVCVNDVTIRDLQQRDGQWTRAKGFDTSCPIGPRIVAGLDPDNLVVTTRLNGEVRQQASTAQMIFGVAELIAYASELLTLEEGDIISTGTPAGVGNLAPGDTVDVEIEGIGVLSNPVLGEPA